MFSCPAARDRTSTRMVRGRGLKEWVTHRRNVSESGHPAQGFFIGCRVVAAGAAQCPIPTLHRNPSGSLPESSVPAPELWLQCRSPPAGERTPPFHGRSPCIRHVKARGQHDAPTLRFAWFSLSHPPPPASPPPPFPSFLFHTQPPPPPPLPSSPPSCLTPSHPLLLPNFHSSHHLITIFTNHSGSFHPQCQADQ